MAQSDPSRGSIRSAVMGPSSLNDWHHRLKATGWETGDFDAR